MNQPKCHNYRTDPFTAQGFARRNSTVNFGTLLEFGYAIVTTSQSEYKPRDEDERVIAIPFLVTPGTINLEGPDADEPISLALSPGNYLVVAAQRVTGDDGEAIDLYFQRFDTLPKQSKII